MIQDASTATKQNGAVATCEMQASAKETSSSTVVERARALSPTPATQVRQQID